ncbi:hypothetical protein ACHAWC_008330 [Mediolabrus comicus]
MIGRYTEEALLKRAKEVVEEKAKGSDFFDEDAEKDMPRFKRSELKLGRVLGRGGFCTVSEITSLNLEQNSPLDIAVKNMQAADEEEDEFGELRYDSHGLIQDRQFLARRCLRKGKHARYAIKTLSDECLADPERFVGGIIDLATESRFLSVVRHANIIKMRAVADGDLYDSRFFVVLDRLYDTLTLKISKWKKASSKFSGVGKMLDMKGKKKNKVWIERLLCVYDLSTALEYLHSNKIIYRDLKPDNVGFDVRGDVKIFDFGLAREFPKGGKKFADDTYQMSGKTGSLRYMAPEVAKEKPYNETVDVYSLAMMAWQIFEMDTPFSGYSIAMHNELVVEKGGRPKIDPKWGTRLGLWMSKAWSQKISERPNMRLSSKAFRDEVNLLQDDIEDFSQIDASSRTANSATR